MAFVVRRPGDYVVFAWSGVYAREDRLHGVVTKGHYATPMRLRIDGNAPIAAQRSPRRDELILARHYCSPMQHRSATAPGSDAPFRV